MNTVSDYQSTRRLPIVKGQISTVMSRISGMEGEAKDEGGEITGKSRRGDEERNRRNANVPRGGYVRGWWHRLRWGWYRGRMLKFPIF